MKANALALALLVSIIGQQGCATTRQRQTAGGLMMVGGGVVMVGTLFALSHCDPGPHPGDNSHTDTFSTCGASPPISGTTGSVAAAVGFGLATFGAITYLTTLGHQSSTITPSLAPVAPPPPPPPSAPIVPLPHGATAMLSGDRR